MPMVIWAEMRIPAMTTGQASGSSTHSTLNDALDTMLVASTGAALVGGPRQYFQGVINVETVMQAITELRETQPKEDAPVGVNADAVEEAGESDDHDNNL